MTGTGGNVAVTLNANPNGVAVTGLGGGINLSADRAGTISIATIGNVSSDRRHYGVSCPEPRQSCKRATAPSPVEATAYR
jgi:hypothetical protein